ncbi:hypothetical protein NE237_015729 [Protea cynaroides]|uniref:RNA helicase n=1 Tax=Protea cynaroides TaxID=273540 RepID=A0A9Q0QRD1_9MAGN|nr:hypothetical protein NE237_015729 [Protea cynaroides]
MRSSLNNLEQSLDVNQILFEQEEGFQDSWSSKGDDSNAIILPEKKKKKTNGTILQNVKKKSTMSKSQKRKLKKLEEDEEKVALLSTSIRLLEKHKIREDAYSLLRSSGNIGQVETMKEKRRRAIAFSKAGLEVAQDERPFKKRNNDMACCQSKSNFDESHQNQELSKDDLQCPVVLVREDLNKTSGSLDACQDPTCASPLGTGFLSDTAEPDKGFADDDDGRNIQEDGKNSLLLSCNCYEIKSTKSLDGESNGLKSDSHGSRVLADSATHRPIITPMVVHVSRPNEVERTRKDLPIVMMEQEIMEAINENSALIICGETGCGKTTQVPQFLYEAGFGSNKSGSKSRIIGVTQPRRVAVLATAKRVAFELGLHLGKEVGFQVRHDKRIGDNCSIKFMTDGILLREVQSDFLLRKYTVIVLDEAHERSLNTDILIGMLSRIVQTRQRLYEEQQEKVRSGVSISPENLVSQLKLVLMSATLRVEDFVSGSKLFSENPPVIEVPTRQFPVTIHFSKRTEIVDYIGQAYKKVLSIHKRLPPGGILVFVTGQREVEYLCRKLRKTSRELTEKISKEKESEATAVLDVDPIDQGINMKDISEAFEVHGSSDHQRTDRLSSFDEDRDVLDEEEFDFDDDSGTESDLEFGGDSEGSLKYENPETDGKHFNVLGEPGSLASLKAAFEALASNNMPCPISEGKPDSPINPGSEGCLNQSTSVSKKQCDMTDGPCSSAMCVLPLYAMLPAVAQLRVFEKVSEGKRLVVVATNVAETSLTIPGIKYVVDTGREKVKNYNSSNGMETYEIQWISKASAAQRAGRSGRTGPGHCYRLYSSAVFTNIFSDFSSPEISKIPVDGVVLLMKSMGIDKVANFPFPTPPEATALVEAERCLKALEALDSQGRLTPLGRAMAKYPMSPRHSRMLLTVIHILKEVRSCPRSNLVFAYAVAAAAALSLSSPFIMHFEGSHNNSVDLDRDDKTGNVDTPKILDKEEKLRQKKLKEMAKVARAKFCNPSSDALTIAYALQSFELAENAIEFCKVNALHLKTMEEMSKLRKQLLQLVFHQSSVDGLCEDFLWTYGTLDDVEQAWRISSNKHPLLLNEEELLGQAICAGWADRVAKRIRVISASSDGDRKANAIQYQACMVKETVFLHRRSSVSRTAEFLVYSELLNTKRPYMHGVTSVQPDWLVKYAGSLCNFSAPLSDPKPFYEPLSDQVFCWVSPTFGPHLWQLPLHRLPVRNDVHRVSVFAYALLEGQVLPCLRSAHKFMAAPAVTILRPEAASQKRVGNLINKLMICSRSIDSRAMLRKIWNENPQKLHSEIRDWFQEKFHDQFEELWAQMHHEVLLEPLELFPQRKKKEKRKK